MFQSWFSKRDKETNNEVLLILTIVFIVFGGFIALVLLIVRLAKQNRFDKSTDNKIEIEETDDEKARLVQQLESYKHLLSSCDIQEVEDKEQVLNAIQCLDYYYINKWATQLREAFDTNSLDAVVQKVIREVDEHSDLYTLPMESKEELWDLAQLSDSVFIRNNARFTFFENDA